MARAAIEREHGLTNLSGGSYNNDETYSAQGLDQSWHAVRYGNAAAALTTTGFGAVVPLPRPAEVNALLGS